MTRLFIPLVRSKRRLTLAGAMVVALVISAGVFAYWTTGGTGSASADAGGLEPATISGPATSNATVTITWTAQAAMTPASQNDNITYAVERKVGAGSFAAVGTGGCSGSRPFPTSSCVDTVSSDGTYTYRVVAHFHNSWTATSNAVSVDVDATAPSVVSIVRDDPSPTTTGIVHWTATFSENVSGVDAGDFALAGAGATGASITGVSGSGDTYHVTASTGADGMLSLDLADNDSIQDSVGNPLGGPGTSGAGDGSFTGQAYLVDKTGPVVTVEQKAAQADPTNGLPIRFTVHFDEPVADFDASDVVRGGNATTTAGNVAVSGSGQDYEIEFAAPPAIGNGTITASIAAGAAHDALGNASSASTSSDNSVLYDTVAPTSSASGVDASWHGSAVTVGLSATDPGAPTTGSGVANIKYQVDGGAPQTISGASGNVVVPAPADHSNDGQHTISFFATDNAGNQEAPANSVTVKIDTRMPTSSASGVDASWHGSAVTVGLSATDPGAPTTGSGVANIKYQVDGGATQTISGASGNVVVPAPADHSNDGQHTISFFATDNAGNQEAPANSVTVKIDTTKPSSSLTTSPASPDGSNNWFRQSSVTFTLSASDPGEPASGSGVANIKYQVDGGAQQTYSGAVTVNSQGDHTVAFFATDNAGNVESSNTTHIKLDNVNPSTTLTTTPGSPDGTNGWFKLSSVSFTLGGSDATSGVATRFYKIDGGATQTYSGTVTVNSQGDHTVQYWSTDNAGNTESANTIHIKLDNVAPSLSLSLTAASGAAFTSPGTLTFKQNATTRSFKFVASVTDATSGAASAIYPVLSTNGWTHSPAETVAGSSPYTSTAYTWTTSATSPAGHSISASDQAGNMVSQAITFVNDVTGPTITAVSSGGGTAGLMQAGDTITFTFSEALDPSTVPASVTVTETRSGGATLTISGLLASPVSINQSYLAANNSSGTATGTVALSSGNTIVTVTLGTVSTSGSGVGTGPAQAMTFAPSSGLTDAVGNAATGSFTTPSSFRLF